MQTSALLAARAAGASHCESSADLGRSTTSVSLDESGVQFTDGLVTWPAIETVAADDNGCFEVSGDAATRIQQMSEHTNRLASLYPTQGPPALLLSGTLMHRIKGVHPGQDTEAKLAPLGRLPGKRVLDTATGLGYTAIAAAEAGATVVTVEWDPAVVAVQRRNPWSVDLSDNPAIDRREGDIADMIDTFAEHEFDAILHDPPVFDLAGDLYGLAFYEKLWGVLAPRGRLFHYIGNPDSPSGKRVTHGVVRRLQDAGFGDVRRVPEAFGVSARG